MTKYFLLFVFLFNFAVFISMIYQDFEAEKDFKSYLAYTTDIEKAKEIQKLDKNIVIDKRSTNKEYGIKLWNCTTSCRDYFLIEIAKLYPNNDEVNFPINYIFSENLKIIEKEEEKSLARIINKIDGVYEAKVDIKNIEDKENAIANIEVKISKTTDEEKINRIINNLIYYKAKRKINIIYDYDKDADTYFKYEKRLRKLYKERKYNDIDTLLKEAKITLPKDYIDSLYYFSDIWKKYDEIDKKIEKFPNNYKYYVERANLSYYPATDCRPRMFYTDNLLDYEKALSLNPKATELYEKAGDEACALGNLDKIKLYFNKALEYTNNKDNIYAKLGDVYYSKAKALDLKDDYQKALNYYNKIKDIESVIKYRENLKEQYNIKNRGLSPERYIGLVPAKGNPYWYLPIPKSIKNKLIKKDEKDFYWSKDDLYYRIFDCQRKLKLRDEAKTTCQDKARIVKNEGKNFNTFSNCSLKMLFK